MLFLSQFFASKRSDPGSELGSLILKLLKASFDAESNKSIQHELEIKLSKELEVLLKQYFAASFPTMENPEVLELLVYALGDLSDFPMCSKKLIKLLNYFIEQDEKISEIIQSIIADKIYKEYCRHWFAIPAPKDKIISLTKAATRMLQLLNIVVGELEIKPDCYDTINVLRCLCVNLTELVHMYLYNSQVKTMLSFFNVQYELATRIVASMDPSDEKCVQLKYNEYADHIVKYLRKFHFPVGTTIAAGSVAARLYLLNARREALDGAADPASQDSTLRLNYDNLLNRFGKDVNSKASVVILFSLLQHCDSIELLRLKNREGENILRSHMLNVIAKWDNKADPNYVFYTSHIYYSFTKYFAFNVSYNTIADDLRKDILAIIEDIFVYAQQYWAHSNRIKHYYRMIENCFILLKRLLDFEFDLDSEFRAYICSFFVDKVNESSDVNYVFRMISLYYETVGVENFSHLFRSTLGAWFNEEFTFYKIFDRFMTQQNISTFDADNNKDDGGGGDERLNLPQHLHGYRISDMAELVSIRLILFKDEDIGIVVHEFKHLLSKPTYGDFFFEFIMPKLKNPKALMVLRELFLTLLYFHSNSIPPNSTLAILKCCHQRRCAIEKEMKRLIIARLVATIFQDYYNDQLGLQTLSFLVENDYQTLVANLDQIDQLFTKCAAIQSASGRSELVSSLGKLYHKLSHKIDPNCEAFLSQLLSKCFDNLKLNSYFGSVLVHLGLIHLVLENWINWRPGLLSFPFNSKQVGALFLMLNHNFEEIRKTAVASILLLHHHRLYHFMRREIGQLEDKYDTLQPNDLAIGVNKFRLWFTLTEQLGEQILEDLLQKVNERLATTKLNQMNFVKHPCSPILAAIRSLVCDCIDVNELAKSNPSKWADLLKRLVATCLECSTAVRPIVGNESPEGNLPEEELVTDLKQMHIQSQKLLNSGWMTTRQSALILMHLVASFPVHDNTLLDCDDIGRIIGHFYENQMLLVHRGAFETSSSSFKAIAQSLFRVPTKCSICIGKFGAILAKIDDDLLCDTTGTGHKSITRRSAGLPFVVASIIGAECCNISPPINAPKFVGRLVSFLEQNVSGGNDDGGRIPKKQPHQIVHIFNILKALVCDALLHRFMADWLERIMIATLDWFDKSRYGQYLALGSTHLEQGQQAYSIHNSASMVFSALITRVFGVKRNRTDTSKKNRMSMFLFFSAYSRLYEYIIEVFQSCLDRKEMNMRLNPVLIILSRLTLSKDPNSLSKTTVLCLKIDELLQTCHDARLVRLLIDVYCQISRKSSLANEVEMLVRQIDEHCSGMCLVSHYRLRAWAMLLAQLLAQYSETEQVSDARLNASLEKAYLTLSIYLRLPFTGKAFVSSEFHIIRARIYQLLAHPQCKPTSSFKPIVLDRPESSNDNLVIRDVLNVNWTFDTTVHMLLDGKENFARSLVGLLQEDLPSESRLLLWRCLDQSFTRENKDIMCLYRQYLTFETVFNDQTTELIAYINKQIRRNPAAFTIDDNLPLSTTKDLQTLFRLLEQPKLIESTSSVNLDCISEMLRFAWNCRHQGSMKMIAIDSRHFQQMLALQAKLSIYDHLYHTLQLLLTLIASNENDTLEPNALLGLVGNVKTLVKSYDDDLYQRVGLYSLFQLIPVVEQKPDDLILVDCLCQLYHSLFCLLGDEGSAVQQKACELLHSCANVIISSGYDESTLLDANKYFFIAVELLMNSVQSRMASFFILEVAINITLEEEGDDSQTDADEEEEEEEALFKPTKLNVFNDYDKLVDCLFAKVKKLIDGDGIEHLQTFLSSLLLDDHLSPWFARIHRVQDLLTTNTTISEAYATTLC